MLPDFQEPVQGYGRSARTLQLEDPGASTMPPNPQPATNLQPARFILRGSFPVQRLDFAVAMTRLTLGSDIRVVHCGDPEVVVPHLLVEVGDGRASTARWFGWMLLALHGERADFAVVPVGADRGAIHGHHHDDVDVAAPAPLVAVPRDGTSAPQAPSSRTVAEVASDLSVNDMAVDSEPIVSQPASTPSSSSESMEDSQPTSKPASAPASDTDAWATNGSIRDELAPQVELSMLDEALRCRALALSIVPQKPGAKHPCILWKPYQDQLPTDAELKDWFRQWPDAGIACVLGEISGLFVIDVDGQEAHDELIAKLGAEPIVPKAMSGSGDPYRYHLFFRYPTGLVTKAKSTPWHPKLEFRGSKGIIVLPPSLHKSGKRYRWVNDRSLHELPLTDVPALVRQALEEPAVKSSRTPKQAAPSSSKKLLAFIEVQKLASAYLAKMPPAIEGQNGDKQTYIVACRLVLDFNLTPEQALPVMQEWNERCEPPWSEEELVHKLEAADQEDRPRGALLAKTTAMPVSTAAATGTTASLQLAPGLHDLHDLRFVDKRVALMMETLGGTHGLFAGMSEWPIVDGKELPIVLPLPEACSHWLLKQFPRGGGFLFRDSTGWWALRAVPTPGESVQLLALRWAEARALLRPMQASASQRTVGHTDLTNRPTNLAAFRQELQQIAPKLRLARQAEQLLWYIHAQVLQCQASRVVVADETLAVLLWGTDRSQRPRNWHRQMHDLLTSLVLLRWLPADREAAPEHFSLMQKRWMVLESVRVLETQPDEASKSETSCCPPTCPWHRSRRRHRHYEITVGAGFLGGLTAFATEVEHQFDFHPELAGQFAEMRAFVEQRDDINTTEKRALLKQGQEELKDEQRLRYLPIVAVPLLLMLYGDRLGLSARHRRLVRAVVRETTRANKTRQLDRADHGQIIRSRRVPGKHRKHLVACPYLDENKEYVGFNGNGKLWGRGYSITSWMERCDSALVTEQSSADAARQEVLRFLKNLSHVADRLGIVVAGYRDGDWFRLSELHLLLGSGDLHKALHGLQLRLFAEQDYAQRWRRLVADALTAPGNDQQDPAVAVLDLRTRLAQAGISHQQAAGHLNKSRPFVSLVLEGKKSCPAPVRAQLEALLQGRGQSS